MFFLDYESIYLGYSLSELERIKNILSKEKIVYKCRIMNHSGKWGLIGSRRGLFGSNNLNMDYEKKYEVLVKSIDYKKAKQIISEF